MPNTLKFSAGSLPLLCGLIACASASPLPTNLLKRTINTGATAGLAVGIVVAIIIVGLVVTFFVIHLRRKSHNAALDKERAILSGEKYPDGTDKIDKYASQPEVTAMPRRNKSVKDRLMGPLYRESMHLPQMPKAKIASGNKRASTMTLGEENDSFLNKPWASDTASLHPSFSSKRATRMMMIM